MPKLQSNQRNSKHLRVLVLAALLLVLVLIVGASLANKHTGSRATTSPAARTGGSPSPTPKAGKPGNTGNPGDVAKTGTPTPAPTPTPLGRINVSIDTITPRPDGTLKVANTVSLVNSGSCLLELTDPADRKTSFTGTISPSGQSYFCSLESISGVTETGTWSAKLTATSNGASGYQIMTFKKQ